MLGGGDVWPCRFCVSLGTDGGFHCVSVWELIGQRIYVTPRSSQDLGNGSSWIKLQKEKLFAGSFVAVPFFKIGFMVVGQKPRCPGEHPLDDRISLSRKHGYVMRVAVGFVGLFTYPLAGWVTLTHSYDLVRLTSNAR